MTSLLQLSALARLSWPKCSFGAEVLQPSWRTGDERVASPGPSLDLPSGNSSYWLDLLGQSVTPMGEYGRQGWAPSSLSPEPSLIFGVCGFPGPVAGQVRVWWSAACATRVGASISWARRWRCGRGVAANRQGAGRAGAVVSRSGLPSLPEAPGGQAQESAVDAMLLLRLPAHLGVANQQRMRAWPKHPEPVGRCQISTGHCG
jgi:hypothetical protein